MAILSKDKSLLKAQAHALKPIVLIGGKGATEAVLKEIDRALNDHELIKIKIHSDEREKKHAIVEEICQKNQAELIQIIGNIGIIYRKNLEGEGNEKRRT